MTFSLRNLIAWGALALLAGGTVWALSFRPDPPADFTFINNAEVQSLDPAIISGVIEGRIVDAIFEGLTSTNPKTLVPEPGVAERWEISPDKRVYTFHLRADAKWSDGSPITAHDFWWSHRRMLDPETGGSYGYQLWYVTNAQKYTAGRVAAGDRVEVELNEPVEGALPFARGKTLKGKLVRVDPPFPDSPEEEDIYGKPRTYIVEIDGKESPFIPGNGPNGCHRVMLDFDKVGCRVIDDRTYQMTLINPTAYFLDLTAFYPLYAVNPTCVETYGSPEWTKPGHIVSNGPYNLESRRIRERMRLVKSETYWDRDHVKLHTIDALPVESDTTALNLYLTGRADWIPTVPPAIISEILKQNRDDFHPETLFADNFYRLNVTKPPLNDVRVRKALNMATNKREVVDGVLRSGEDVARSFVPPVIKNYMPYEPALCADYDPAEARKLLAEAGFPGGRGFPKLTLLYNSDETLKMIAELIQRQWKENLGIDLEPLNQEWGAYISAEQSMDYVVARSGWTGDYVDPNTFLGMFITGSEDNETGWSNAHYDELLKAAAEEPDATKRLRQLHDAEAILMDELPFVPLYISKSKNLVRPYVHGFYGNVLDVHPLKWISVDDAARQNTLHAEGLR